MTKTFTNYSVPTPALGSAPRAGGAALGASSVAMPPVAPLRRAVLAGSVAALALAAGITSADSAPLASPDAGLIALCVDLDALQWRINVLFDDNWCSMTDAELEVADAAAYRLDLDQQRLLDRICALRPATLGGCRALAQSVALLRPDLVGATANADMDVRLTAMLVRGLGAGA